MPTLLIIDDDPAIHLAFRRAFQAMPDLRIVSATTVEEGLGLLPVTPPAAVILDVHLPDLSGLEAFGRLRQRDPSVPVLVISGAGTTETVIEAMKLGAFDYLTKPLELAQIRDLVARALEVSRAGEASQSSDLPGEPGAEGTLIGRSPAMQEVYKAIGRVAPRDVTVLIQGESGTGKELVARAIYQHSRRAGAPFLALNCAAIPETLLESELFGHEKGAFTGAEHRRPGKFEQCSGGTLFLDEIGDLAPMAQAKVLRVLQEGSFQRVGGNETIRADVRLLAATHRDLERMAQEGSYRGDLFYRLGVFTIELPPLRERLDDLPLLVEHFLRRFRVELDKEVYEVAPEVLDLLRAYPWPGNLRQLQSVLKRTILRAHGPILLPEFLPPLSVPPPAVVDPTSPPAPAAAPLPSPDVSPSSSVTDWERFVADRFASGSTVVYDEALALMEREVIGRVLRHTEGNQVQAAKILGITRGTLRVKIRSLGIDFNR